MIGTALSVIVIVRRSQKDAVHLESRMTRIEVRLDDLIDRMKNCSSCAAHQGK